jgi:acetyl esterase/lipase
MTTILRIVGCIGFVGLGAAALFEPHAAGAAEKTLPKRTYTYKTVGTTPIQLDVYRPDDRRVLPVVVWIHGGALIMGSRAPVPQNLLDFCRHEGIALVSIDYRLAPETKVPAIAEDLNDAFAWLRAQGPKTLAIDPDRMVVAGGSAGGYMTLLAGATVRPRPKALVAYWGYGDLIWYAEPSAHYRETSPLLSREEAQRDVGQGVVTGSEGKARIRPGRGNFYRYLRQNALWIQEVAGLDPKKDRQVLDRYCPVRNVDSSYPPTLLVHGTADTDVPYSESETMARELARHGVPHELVTVRGAGHGLSGGNPAEVEKAYERSHEFIRKALR